MTRLTWDDAGKRYFETGVSQGVLYPLEAGVYQTGVPWNGLVSVTESPTGGEANPQYADNLKYLNLMSTEEFGGTIEAFTYPDEFAECDGSLEAADGAALGLFVGQQARKPFGLVWKTLIGNDEDGDQHGYKIHIVYGCMAQPSERSYQTVNDSPEAATFSWEITATPVVVTGYKPFSSFTVDSRTANATCLAALEDLLFGDDAAGLASLPTPETVITTMTPAG